jgi:glucose-6-phosphate isomerase, archaeal
MLAGAGSIDPFGAILDSATGVVEPTGVVTENRVSDMINLYEEEAAWRRTVEAENPIVYRVVSGPVPEEAGEVPFSITTIEAGTVGDEFFMTKGHAHTSYEGELYVGLSGRGLLLLYDGDEARWLEILPNRAGYIPPGWAHRTVNVGNEPFRFLAVYPGDAGHDYEFVARKGMGARVRRAPEGYEVRTAGGRVESVAGEQDERERSS